MRRGQQITLKIAGSEGNKTLRLSEFIDQLRTLMNSLKKTETVYFGRSDPTLFYRIVDLSYNSPARIVLEVDSEQEAPVYASHVVRTFAAALRRVDSGRTLGKPNLVALESYRDLTGPLQKHISDISISIGNRTININSKFKQKVDKIIGPDQKSFGSVSGKLEALNLHRTNQFSIYPSAGATKVTGSFPVEKRETVKAGIDRFVTVHGILRYKMWSPFPHAIDANDIEVHPQESDLPRLSDLKGIAPNLTAKAPNENW